MKVYLRARNACTHPPPRGKRQDNNPGLQRFTESDGLIGHVRLGDRLVPNKRFQFLTGKNWAQVACALEFMVSPDKSAEKIGS